MRIVGIRQFCDQAPALLKAVRRGEALLLTRHGQPVGLVLPLNENDWEDVVLAHHPQFQREWEEARRQIARGEFTTLRHLLARAKEK